MVRSFSTYHLIPGRVELHAGHEGPHQHDAAAARAVELLGAGGVGQRGGIEARPLVANLDPHAVRLQAARHMDLLAAIEAVAVLDGVHQRLLHRQMDAEDVPLQPVLQPSGGR